MEIGELDIWERNSPTAWARDAAERWATLAKRAALLYMDVFVASPLPRTETEVLMLVWEDPEAAEPARLAEKLRVSRQTMTGILDKLERARCLERASHPSDRRRKSIRLLPRGRAVVRDFSGAVLRHEAALFETRSEAEVAGAFDKLGAFLDHMEKWDREHPLRKAKGGRRAANS